METLGLSTWETLERGNGIQTVLSGVVGVCGCLGRFLRVVYHQRVGGLVGARVYSQLRGLQL